MPVRRRGAVAMDGQQRDTGGTTNPRAVGGVFAVVKRLWYWHRQPRQGMVDKWLRLVNTHV